jgi:hypothetical protein
VVITVYHVVSRRDGPVTPSSAPLVAVPTLATSTPSVPALDRQVEVALEVPPGEPTGTRPDPAHVPRSGPSTRLGTNEHRALEQREALPQPHERFGSGERRRELRRDPVPSPRDPVVRGRDGGVQKGDDRQVGEDAPTRSAGQTPVDPLERASQALAAGHPEECVAILDEVIGRGATPFALRRRADCLLRAGRQEEAIRDYQRFCRIAPDHPAVVGIRLQLGRMGLTCP